MRQRHSQAYYTQEQRFNDRFPSAIVAILAIMQMLITFAIIAFEIGHIVINIRLTNLFVGFWASVPFTFLWISMFAAVCCCRRRSCATHAAIQNVISFLFACVLIAINIVFLRRPNECFLTAGVCNSISSINGISVSYVCLYNDKTDDCGKTRLALIKAQLAAGVFMAVTCFLYLILYLAIASRANRRPTAATAVMTSVYQQQPYTVPPQSYQPSAPVMIPSYQQATPQMVPVHNDVNYLPSYQHATIYPKIPNDRF